MSHSANYLYEHEPQEQVQVHRKKRIVLKFFLILLVVIVLYGLGGVIYAGKIVAHALDGKVATEEAQTALLDLEFDTARDKLSEAEVNFSAAAAGTTYFLPLRVLPWVGEQLKATEAIFRAGSDTAKTLEDLIEVAEDVVRLAVGSEALVQGLDVSEQLSWYDLSPEVKKAIILRFASSASDLELAQLNIDLILRDLDELPKESLIGPLREVLDPFVDQLLVLDEALETLIPVSFVLPSFAGLDQEQHVLVLFLNNAEMRPGGGFIGSYGIVSFLNGEMTRFETHDVMDVDGPAAAFRTQYPPEPIQQYLGETVWYFRDSNWSPDFAVSSENSLKIFRASTADAPEGTVLKQPYVQFDAVVGITPDFVADLLTITGPVTVEDQTFTSSNIFETLEYAVEYGFDEKGIPFDQRKEILGPLSDQIRDGLFTLPSSEWGKVFEAVSEALNEKQFVIYSADQTTHEIIAGKDWAGRVIPGEVDTLMVVDANMAALKTDASVDKSIDYSISGTSEGRYVAKVTVTYNHFGTFDWKTTRYRTYTRVYVPLGSELIRYDGLLEDDALRNPSLTPGSVEVSEELDLTVFGGFFSVEPGEIGSFTYEYLLPESVTDAVEAGMYELDVIKQVGADKHGLTIDLDFDKPVKSAYPSEEPSEFGDDRYLLNTKLDHNLEFTVSF